MLNLRRDSCALDRLTAALTRFSRIVSVISLAKPAARMEESKALVPKNNGAKARRIEQKTCIHINDMHA
jgi:hypothetical protein